MLVTGSRPHNMIIVLLKYVQYAMMYCWAYALAKSILR